jgi:outer membrane protein
VRQRQLQAFLLTGSSCLVFLLFAAAVRAQDATPQAGEVYVRGGIAGVLFEPGAKFTVAGQRLPDASLTTSDNVTVAAELGYYLRTDVSLSLTVGVPPDTAVNGTGALATIGRLGTVRYGTVAALADYHFNYFGRFQPWVGVGPAFFAIFGTTGDAIQNLKVSDQWGAAVQAGAEYMINQNWGIYTSVSQLFAHTNASGSFAGLSVTSKVDLNPLIIQGGLTFRF